MRLIAGLMRRKRRVPAVEIATATAWVAGLAVIETVGRQLTTDLGDLGMTYDDDSDAAKDREGAAIDEIVGPPYHRVFRPEARYHFWQVTRALEIDLIFVEHAVPFRRLVRVLRQMFETYDIFGGRQRAEEWHFCGLPGVRVMIHDFDFSDSAAYRPEGYPEPNYEEIGRARILHVFKDRGEQEALDPVPGEWEGLPVPAGRL